jgi:sugar/nucleoside kinase (ribokinase family)
VIRKLDVLVVGGANVDYLIKGAVLPAPGDTVVGESLDEAPGGKGANQAIAAARLGIRWSRRRRRTWPRRHDARRDAFVAGIAAGLAENRSLSDAAWLGCVTAALKSTRLGAQAGLPNRAEVDQMLSSIKRD